MSGFARIAAAGSKGWSRGAPGAAAHADGGAGVGVRAQARAARADGGRHRCIRSCSSRVRRCRGCARCRRISSRGRPLPGQGLWPVRGRGTQRAVDRRRAARPQAEWRRPSGGAVGLHRRSLTVAGRVAVGHRRGCDPPGSRTPSWVDGARRAGGDPHGFCSAPQNPCSVHEPVMCPALASGWSVMAVGRWRVLILAT